VPPASRRYLKPGFFTSRVFNPVIGWFVRRGANVAGAAILEVTGRRSGEPRTTPVNPLPLAGERYLLAPRGETEWVRNIRVAGIAALLTGRRREEIAVTEVPDAEKLPIIREYLVKWAWEVGAFFEGLSAKSSDDEVNAVAAGFPVFLISRAEMRPTD
jgi:deazaflavin-dependent oxidoreductase (nitroreductase family)